MIKTSMNLAGLKGGRVRAPLIELSHEDGEDLEALLEKIGVNARGVAV
jgi:dihydrodipicolinate synthase/N-acetylneuraminate lyase